MKGKYNGRHMRIYGAILPGIVPVTRSGFLAQGLTERAKYKLKVIDWHREHKKNSSLTSRHFGIGRMTLYRWLKRFKQCGLIGLNDKSKRPKRIRKPVTSWKIVSRTVQLRRQYPACSEYKLKVLLEKENIQASVSTVGRILKRRRKSALHPKRRFPKGLSISRPGDMLQIDTKYIILTGGKRFYQFTTIDVLTKRRILRVYSSQSSRNRAKFLKECLMKFPFPVKAVQTDNGSPFLKEFDKLCKEKGLLHSS